MKTIGIDLGTTNTAVAIEGRVIPLQDGRQSSPILPSVVAFPPTGVTLVGTSARARRAIDPKNTIFSAKRIIGRLWHTYEIREFRDHYPHDLVQSDDGHAAFETRVGTITPIDVGATVLKTTCQQAGFESGQYRAVVAVPYEFRETSRQATIDAAHKAGFAEVQLLEEPVASALAYLNNRDKDIKTAVVYDLGGGTFDLAVVDCASQPHRVLAHGGDIYLGGDDIDRAVAEWAATEVRRTHDWDLQADPTVFDRLLIECERAKIRLCYVEKTRIELSQVDPAATIADHIVSVTRDHLKEVTSNLVRRTFVLLDEVIAKAGVQAANVDAVFLVGGTAQLPMVKTGLQMYFNKVPRCEFDPMEVVAIGASLFEG